MQVLVRMKQGEKMIRPLNLKLNHPKKRAKRNRYYHTCLLTYVNYYNVNCRCYLNLHIYKSAYNGCTHILKCF